MGAPDALVYVVGSPTNCRSDGQSTDNHESRVERSLQGSGGGVPDVNNNTMWALVLRLHSSRIGGRERGTRAMPLGSPPTS